MLQICTNFLGFLVDLEMLMLFTLRQLLFMGFLKKNIGMVGNDSHSLKPTDNLLARDIIGLSSEAKKGML